MIEFEGPYHYIKDEYHMLGEPSPFTDFNAAVRGEADPAMTDWLLENLNR